MIAAYSSNPTAAAEADIGSGVRKGSGISLNPNMEGKNYQIGYSYWNAKPDGKAAVDERSDRLYGSYSWGGFKLGLAWDRSKLTTAATGARTSNRTAWSLPTQYKWGKHGIYAHYTVARNDTATVGADGAKLVALAYAYEFFKNTSVAATYTKITNDATAIYQPFASGTGGLGPGTGAIAAGEDPTLFALTLRYSF